MNHVGPNATGANDLGKGTAPVVPRPGSCEAVAVAALAAFAFEERLAGAAKAHESFDGILTEHALALESVRDVLREAYGRCLGREPARENILKALEMLRQEITYVRALGSVAATEEEEDAK